MEEKKIIPGRNPAYEYMRSGAKCERILIAEGSHGKVIDQIMELAKKNKTPVRKSKKEELDRLFDGNHQGVILIAQKSSSNDYSLKAIAERKGSIVILDQLTDPHNVGAIIRTAEALGVEAILMQKANSPGMTETVVKSSAGATAYIHIEYVTNIARLIDDAKEAGFWVIGTTDHGTKLVKDVANVKPAAVIIGNEGTGMRRLTEEKCDYLVRIDLKGRMNSLNASVAAGIVLYELLGR